jgi:hypothetical protein
MIAKGFTPFRGAKVFVIMKTLPQPAHPRLGETPPEATLRGTSTS